MKTAFFLLPLMLLLFASLPLGIAEGDTGDDAPFFGIGNFAVTRDGEITGAYIPRALDGMTVSLYSDTGEHVMDIFYRECCIDVYIEIFDDSLMKTLFERGILERGNILKLTFSGRPQMAFTYENCTVELQDATISLLRIQTTGYITFSNLTRYTIIQNSPCSLSLSTEGFYGTLVGHHEILREDEILTTEGSVTFRGINLGSPEKNNITEIITVEDAITQGDLGGEITIVKRENTLDWMTTSYANNVTIEVQNTSLTGTKTHLVVSGDENAAGKTIKVNLGKGVLSLDDLHLTFDGTTIPLADNISDVLDPNNDGLQPEYVLVKVTGGKEQEFFVLVSIPHFSEHIITLESIRTNPVLFGITLASAFAVIALASWVIFFKR